MGHRRRLAGQLRMERLGESAMRMKPQPDAWRTWSVNLSCDTSTTRPCSASLGENADESAGKTSEKPSAAPCFLCSKTALHLSVHAHIEQHQGSAPSARGASSFNQPLCFVIQISYCKLRPKSAKRLRTSHHADRLVIGNADDEP